MKPIITMATADLHGFAVVCWVSSWLPAVPPCVIAQAGAPAIIFGNMLFLSILHGLTAEEQVSICADAALIV